jgi:membrane protein involved in colicin uptake
MEESNEIKTLLTELRDSQQALEAEYKRVTQESLAMQREALELQKQAVENQSKAIAEQNRSVKMQAQFGRLYRIVLVVAAVLVAVLLVRLASF